MRYLLPAFISGSILDIDVFLRAINFSAHRGATHSILGVFLIAVIIGLIFHKRGIKNSFFASLVCGYLHVGLDFLFPYSIYLFWPFSYQEYTIYGFVFRHGMSIPIYVITINLSMMLIIWSIAAIQWRKRGKPKIKDLLYGYQD